jgi:osmotically-inducible protein OsmY
MQSRTGRAALAASSLVLLLALGACGDRVENTEAPQPAQASLELDRQAMPAAQDAQPATGGAHDTNQMGAAAGTSAAADADERIAADVKSVLQRDAAIGTTTKIDVYSENGAVSLRGQAPDPQARERATELAKGVRDVKSVDNQLTLG